MWRMDPRKAGFSAVVSERTLISRDKVGEILHPAGHQPPAHEREATLSLFKPNDRDRLRGRYVVAGRKVRLVRIAKYGAHFFGGRG